MSEAKKVDVLDQLEQDGKYIAAEIKTARKYEAAFKEKAGGFATVGYPLASPLVGAGACHPAQPHRGRATSTEGPHHRLSRSDAGGAAAAAQAA
jgi:hypothetical protein